MNRSIGILLLLAGLLLWGCLGPHKPVHTQSYETVFAGERDSLKPEPDTALYRYITPRDISIQSYFSWIDSLIIHFDSLTPYELNSHLIVHANAWLIDTFAHTDYYHLMARDTFVYDQKQLVVIPEGRELIIPAPNLADSLTRHLNEIWIDINLPEYTLRLCKGAEVLDSFPIRIGQNRTKFLPSEQREFNLQTRTGEGYISGIITSPRYVNFNTGEVYSHTRRDDGKTTLMPLIPTLEPEINGICYGQLIHATTNPETLGKAYSHGCIGTKEGDAWRIYFHTQLGTPLLIRYELVRLDGKGDTLLLPDVYHRKKDPT